MRSPRLCQRHLPLWATTISSMSCRCYVLVDDVSLSRLPPQGPDRGARCNRSQPLPPPVLVSVSCTSVLLSIDAPAIMREDIPRLLVFFRLQKPCAITGASIATKTPRPLCLGKDFECLDIRATAPAVSKFHCSRGSSTFGDVLPRTLSTQAILLPISTVPRLATFFSGLRHILIPVLASA
ncbi:hypothetical protein BC628DRAFT_462831 [Trametes gibbosa]|nr:hypothetical protein BC628DRAFT_462831 [Trametes gibbosa]